MTEVSTEMTGETVGEAKWAALRELERMHPGLDKSSVRFQVVSEGQRGLLGVGYEPARVVATFDGEEASGPEEGAAPVDEGDDAALLRELVSRIAHEIGVQCSLEIDETDDEILVTCSGRELGMLIGRHGQTIDAIQYLANAILFRAREDRKRVVVDAAGYRARRQAALDGIAVARRGAGVCDGPARRARVDVGRGATDRPRAVEGGPRGRDAERGNGAEPLRRGHPALDLCLSCSSAGSPPSWRRPG